MAKRGAVRSETTLYSQQMYSPVHQDKPGFYAWFSEDINTVVEKFAANRIGFYGIRMQNFRLVPSVHFEVGSGETLSGFVLEGHYRFDHLKGDILTEYHAIVEAVEVDGPEQSGCDVQPCIKLTIDAARDANTHENLRVNRYVVTDDPAHADVLQAFADFHDRVADLCLDLTHTLEDYYDDRVAEWSAVKRGF